MPFYGKFKVDRYSVRIFSNETLRVLPIVPYFWDTNINLDLIVEPRKQHTGFKFDSVKYIWELVNIDGDVIKNGEGDYKFSHSIGFGQPRKVRAIKIGYLRPHQQYILNLCLEDSLGQTPYRPVASFTVKDRDELYMQTFIGIIVIAIGILIGLIAGN